MTWFSYPFVVIPVSLSMKSMQVAEDHTWAAFLNALVAFSTERIFCLLLPMRSQLNENHWEKQTYIRGEWVIHLIIRPQIIRIQIVTKCLSFSAIASILFDILHKLLNLLSKRRAALSKTEQRLKNDSSGYTLWEWCLLEIVRIPLCCCGWRPQLCSPMIRC